MGQIGCLDTIEYAHLHLVNIHSNKQDVTEQQQHVTPNSKGRSIPKTVQQWIRGGGFRVFVEIDDTRGNYKSGEGPGGIYDIWVAS